MRTLSATRWGLRVPTLKALHKGAVIPVAAYSASVWAHRLRENVGLAKTLNRAQRPTLLSMVGAYRTAPMEALHVLTGIMPLDLEVRRRSDLYGRRQAQAEHSPYRTLAEIDSDLLGEWQNRWELSGDGRVTFTFLPNIQWRLARSWFVLDHFSAQLVIGHGAFAAYLHRFGISGVEHCECDGVSTETSWHVLLHCSLHADRRSQLTEALYLAGVRGPWNVTDLVSSPRAIAALAEYARAILEPRERR